jgi:hypothetical protein
MSISVRRRKWRDTLATGNTFWWTLYLSSPLQLKSTNIIIFSFIFRWNKCLFFTVSYSIEFSKIFSSNLASKSRLMINLYLEMSMVLTNVRSRLDHMQLICAFQFFKYCFAIFKWIIYVLVESDKCKSKSFKKMTFSRK